MPPWLPGTLVAIVGLLVSAFCSFYFKWVPAVEDQKRHMRQAAWWVFDAGTIVCQVWPLYALAHVMGPVTPSHIVRGAMSGAGLAFCSALIVARRTYGRLLNRQIENFGTLMEVHDKTFANQMEAMRILSHRVDLTAEVAQKLNALLGVKTPETTPQ